MDIVKIVEEYVQVRHIGSPGIEDIFESVETALCIIKEKTV